MEKKTHMLHKAFIQELMHGNLGLHAPSRINCLFHREGTPFKQPAERYLHGWTKITNAAWHCHTLPKHSKTMFLSVKRPGFSNSAGSSSFLAVKIWRDRVNWITILSVDVSFLQVTIWKSVLDDAWTDSTILRRLSPQFLYGTVAGMVD